MKSLKINIFICWINSIFLDKFQILKNFDLRVMAHFFQFETSSTLLWEMNNALPAYQNIQNIKYHHKNIQTWFLDTKKNFHFFVQKSNFWNFLEFFWILLEHQIFDWRVHVLHHRHWMLLYNTSNMSQELTKGCKTFLRS